MSKTIGFKTVNVNFKLWNLMTKVDGEEFEIRVTDGLETYSTTSKIDLDDYKFFKVQGLFSDVQNWTDKMRKMLMDEKCPTLMQFIKSDIDDHFEQEKENIGSVTGVVIDENSIVDHKITISVRYCDSKILRRKLFELTLNRETAGIDEIQKAMAKRIEDLEGENCKNEQLGELNEKLKRVAVIAIQAGKDEKKSLWSKFAKWINEKKDTIKERQEGANECKEKLVQRTKEKFDLHAETTGLKINLKMGDEEEVEMDEESDEDKNQKQSLLEDEEMDGKDDDTDENMGEKGMEFTETQYL